MASSMITDNMKTTYTTKKERGFALFVAIGVTSILLLVSMSMVNVSLKQTIIASAARESQKAFYAADNGIECVLYWEVINPTFPGESPFDPSSAGPQDIECAGQTFTVGQGATSEFTLNFTPFATCAVVEVVKSGSQTTIRSRGRNSCDVNNARRVERGVRVQYGS